MEILTLDFVEGARAARGVAVIIDVFRAFTTACQAFHNGAERILPAGTIEEAFVLKARHPDAVTLGERTQVDRFDFVLRLLRGDGLVRQ